MPICNILILYSKNTTMKKILTLFFAILFILPFIGCFKEDGLLTGTFWTVTQTRGDNHGDKMNESVYSYTLKFISKSDFTFSSQATEYENGISKGIKKNIVNGTYTYNVNQENGTLTFQDEKGKSTTLHFIVDGKSLTITNEEGEKIIFAKK